MKHMTLKKIVLYIAAMVLVMGTFVACGNNNPSGTYTIHVVTEGGMAMEDIGIKVYTDTSKDDIVAVETTDKEGTVSFDTQGSMGDVIYLENVPTGYVVEETYEITSQETTIVLKAQLLSEENLGKVKFKLGSVFADMSVTASDGKTYKISELLKEKKAVVLNFWYLNCSPCKIEFPYMQESYETHQKDLEILALNPCDGTDATIEKFKSENNLTFPMAVADEDWATYMGLTAYPTTVVIDRYGTIGYIHTGMITSVEEFDTLFDFFTADDYKQSVIRKLSDIK